MIYRRFLNWSSSDDECTMMSDKNVINRRNVKEDPHIAYRADRNFLVLEVTSRVIAASYKVLGLTSRADKRKIVSIPEDINEWSKLRQLLKLLMRWWLITK